MLMFHVKPIGKLPMAQGETSAAVHVVKIPMSKSSNSVCDGNLGIAKRERGLKLKSDKDKLSHSVGPDGGRGVVAKGGRAAGSKLDKLSLRVWVCRMQFSIKFLAT